MKAQPLISDRAPFSAIVDRAPWQAPQGARMLVWIIVNVEHWSIERPMPRTVLSPPMGQPLLPDVPNWAWHEYGMRVGFWRFLEALGQRGIKATLAINGIVCQSYPRIAMAAHKAGWEFMGHGYVQAPMHQLADQAEAVAQTIDAIATCTGAAPVGWESPGLTQTDETLDILSKAGIRYVADWVLDDQPVWLRAKPKPVLSVPYTVEINDIPMMLLQAHRAEEFYSRGLAQLDRLWLDSARQTRVMSISIHPYIMGVPHRIAQLERLLDALLAKPEVHLCTGSEIAQCYADQIPAPDPSP
ncbi:MAG: polysaccharide deacetylase [Betaproteobacteria bacterium]|nr:polysaccharide deacetylase [Betaproteobacteria bacterium]